MADRPVILTGPTASGKTALAIEIALHIDAEVISADSRQVYRGMDIGTAKATAAERARVPHHGLDLVAPGERYSAGRFARDARRWIDEIRGRGKVPLLAGGTGFFLRALTHPLFREPPLEPGQRERLHEYLQTLPDGERVRWLHALDPEAADRLSDGGGRQRVMRALEVALLTGRPLAWWQRNAAPREEPLDAAIFVLDLPRALLYGKINERVDAMVRAGLVEEVRGLLERGRGLGDPGLNATGYPELAAFLHGETDLDEAKDRIRRSTRRYARRQLTWFRNQLPPGAVWLDGTKPLNELRDEVVRQWRSAR
jgi:tRNA dimethylallyltransferase